MTTDKFSRRMAIWRHNGLLGMAKRALLFVIYVEKAELTTIESKRLAKQARPILEALSTSLRTRKDQL